MPVQDTSSIVSSFQFSFHSGVCTNVEKKTWKIYIWRAKSATFFTDFLLRTLSPPMEGRPRKEWKEWVCTRRMFSCFIFSLSRALAIVQYSLLCVLSLLEKKIVRAQLRERKKDACYSIPPHEWLSSSSHHEWWWLLLMSIFFLLLLPCFFSDNGSLHFFLTCLQEKKKIIGEGKRKKIL